MPPAIVRSLAMFDDIHVHDNSLGPDLAVYGRYALIPETDRPVVLVQDDDVILPPESITGLLAAYEPGKITANMPERFRPHYADSCLVGFGAVFDRDLPDAAFDRFKGIDPPTWPEILRTCDVVFTALTDRVLVDLPIEILPYAYGDDRMYRQPQHNGDRRRMLELARRVRDRAAA